MIIRSQDKTAITTDLNMYVRINDFVHGKVKWEIRNATQDLLATYSTEEKAVKVLDMICDACRNTAFIDEKAVVFEMPQDCEV